jgi:hypothetical protein
LEAGLLALTAGLVAGAADFVAAALVEADAAFFATGLAAGAGFPVAGFRAGGRDAAGGVVLAACFTDAAGFGW